MVGALTKWSSFCKLWSWPLGKVLARSVLKISAIWGRNYFCLSSRSQPPWSLHATLWSQTSRFPELQDFNVLPRAVINSSVVSPPLLGLVEKIPAPFSVEFHTLRTVVAERSAQGRLFKAFELIFCRRWQQSHATQCRALTKFYMHI